MSDRTCNTCVKWRQAKPFDRGTCMRVIHPTHAMDSCKHYLSKESPSITEHPDVQRLIKEVVRFQATVKTLQSQVVILAVACKKAVELIDAIEHQPLLGESKDLILIRKAITSVEKEEDHVK